MDRRDSIKALLVGTVSAGFVLEGCDNVDQKTPKEVKAEAGNSNDDRMEEEIAYNKELQSETFFNEHEMGTIAVLANIIIPADDVSGSATDAEVPDFIEFIVKDKPNYQTPMRGGMRWLDLQCIERYGKTFRDADSKQQLEMVDLLAYPKKARPELTQGVNFFNLMRNLTVTGFYTSKIGIKDVGYMGNQPNQWNGVPADVLKQYNMAYTEKELKECISYDKA